MIACGKIVSTGTDICIVRELHSQTTIHGTPLLNEFDCPLLLLSGILYIFPTSYIHTPVSVVHACSDSCKFTSDISTFEHDMSNTLFYYNIYCISIK